LQLLQKEGHIDLFYGDESGFSLTPLVPYGWQLRDEPVCICPQPSKRINAFGIMNADNELHLFQKEGSIKADFVVESIEKWMERLIRPTVLVLDNGRVHQCKLLWDKIESWQEKNLFVFFLPTYSPHLNKIETLWRKVKYEWLKVSDYASLDTLKEALNQIYNQFGEQYTIQFNSS
jgi:transposase